MLDFRIVIAAIIVCVSLVMTGARLLSTSENFSVAIGLRPGVTPMTEAQRPKVVARPIVPAIAEPPTGAITPRPPARFDLPTPAIIARPLIPSQPSSTTAGDRAIVSTPPSAAAKAIEPEAVGPGAKPTSPPPATTAAAPSPAARSTRTLNPPAPEITGSIPVHPEAEPNVVPDWQQKSRPSRNVAATPTRSRTEDASPILEFFYSNSIAK